jgi:hypothetical protein
MTASQKAGFAAQQGVSPSNLAKALMGTPAERAALIAGDLTIDVMPAAKPQSMTEFIAMFQSLTPAQRTAFARAVGIERVWQPSQR